MQSSENRIDHSPQLCHIQCFNSAELDQNSQNKSNALHQPSAIMKMPLSAQAKNMARQLMKRIEMLEQKIDSLQSRQVEHPRKKKKLRRRARQVPRTYKCMFSTCGKEYGSEASLKNHHKIKHGIRIIRKPRAVNREQDQQQE